MVRRAHAAAGAGLEALRAPVFKEVTVYFRIACLQLCAMPRAATVPAAWQSFRPGPRASRPLRESRVFKASGRRDDPEGGIGRAAPWGTGRRGRRRSQRVTRRRSTLDDVDGPPIGWLERFGLARDGQLTRAAILLCGTEASRLRVKPTPIVDVRVYAARSDDPVPATQWVDRLVCDGNVVQALAEALGRLERLVPNPFALEADGVTRRAHGPHLPVLREALVNLLTHQDYGDGARVATVKWFHDRVVFDNPGDSLLAPSEMRYGGTSASRNQLIQRMLRLSGHAEQAGLGLPTMRSQWAMLEGASPDVSSDTTTKWYRVAFPFRVSGGPAFGAPPLASGVLREVTPEVTPDDGALALVTVVIGEATRRELQDRLGMADEKHFREAYLRPAIIAGLVEMTEPERPRSPRQRYRLTAAGERRRAMAATALPSPASAGGAGVGGAFSRG